MDATTLLTNTALAERVLDRSVIRSFRKFTYHPKPIMKSIWFNAKDAEIYKSVPILFCFPYAGGGVNIFRPWQNHVGNKLRVCPIRLPGRDLRIREPLQTSMEELTDDILSTLNPYLSQPFAFFGHSMGGIIAHSLAVKLMKHKKCPPVALFISARGWYESIPEQLKNTVSMSDKEFSNFVLKTSPENSVMLSNPEARSIFLPMLRADYELCASWRPQIASSPVNTPIYVMHGNEDEAISLNAVKAWRYKTTRDFDFRIMKGNHFFIHHQYPQMLDWIQEKLAKIKNLQ